MLATNKQHVASLIATDILRMIDGRGLPRTDKIKAIKTPNDVLACMWEEWKRSVDENIPYSDPEAEYQLGVLYCIVLMNELLGIEGTATPA
jgi:hypothetical protein